jgi:hypothetical protein
MLELGHYSKDNTMKIALVCSSLFFFQDELQHSRYPTLDRCATSLQYAQNYKNQPHYILKQTSFCPMFVFFILFTGHHLLDIHPRTNFSSYVVCIDVPSLM